MSQKASLPIKYSLADLSEEAVAREVKTFLPAGASLPKEHLEIMLSCLDLTSLGSTDNRARIEKLVDQALSINKFAKITPSPAAICVYGTLIPVLRPLLQGSGIKIAAVSTAFPTGMAPLETKIDETKRYLDWGADEIDMVISRGEFLAGNYDQIFDEVAAIKGVCAAKTLKVILETGELPSLSHIALASKIALEAGADFIKTSTGKIPQGATLEAVYVMCLAIKAHFERTKFRAGIKPSGGVANAEQALGYFNLVRELLGREWLNGSLLRYGASKLADDLVLKLS